MLCKGQSEVSVQLTLCFLHDKDVFDERRHFFFFSQSTVDPKAFQLGKVKDSDSFEMVNDNHPFRAREAWVLAFHGLASNRRLLIGASILRLCNLQY